MPHPEDLCSRAEFAFTNIRQFLARKPANPADPEQEYLYPPADGFCKLFGGVSAIPESRFNALDRAILRNAMCPFGKPA
jgi:hypothetical protein